MVVTLDAKRRLTVPAALAPAKPGDYFDAHFDAEEDALVFRRLGGRERLARCDESVPGEPGRRAAPAPRAAASGGSCELAARHGRHLPAGEEERRSRMIAWLEAEQDRCYTSAVVIAQLAYWVRTKEGRQRQHSRRG